MSIVFKLGSFPNSQNRPRSPVRESEMIEVSLPVGGTEVLILSENAARIRAIIKVSGANPVKFDYVAGPSDGFTVNPGGSLTIENGNDDVFGTPIGGPSAVEIDDRVG